MICFVKPGLTEDLDIVHKEELNNNNMLYVRYVHLTKAKTIHKKQTNPLVREDVPKYCDHKGSLAKKKKKQQKQKQTKTFGHEPQGAWYQGELIGGKPPVIK
jgi:hypothetical protein